MPELPEVEVSRLGISPHLTNHKITAVVIRDGRLRWPIPDEVKQLQGQVIRSVSRRAKYLLLNTDVGTAILHLGMSGKLRVVPRSTPVKKHDHLDLEIETGQVLRFNDPRRFGAFLWQEDGAAEHPLLSKLGPEPLSDAFDGERLFQLSRGRSTAVKQMIMDNHVVVGVGNIYANEALFMAGIDPRREAGRISKTRYLKLGECIRKVLSAAIEQGGTTLKDFTQADGKPGYFVQELQVYGKGGEPCPVCEATIQEKKIGQRNSFFCSRCQR